MAYTWLVVTKPGLFKLIDDLNAARPNYYVELKVAPWNGVDGDYSVNLSPKQRKSLQSYNEKKSLKERYGSG